MTETPQAERTIARPLPRPHSSAWLIELGLVTLLFALYGYFLQVPGPNELSRYDLSLALLQDKTTQIDRYETNTIDKGRFDNHDFTDKAIGTSLLGLPALAVLDRLQGIGPYGALRAEYPVGAAARLAVGLPCALAAWALFRMLRRAGLGGNGALVAVISVALGSAFFPFATHLYGHAAAGAFLALSAGLVFFRPQASTEWRAGEPSAHRRVGWAGWAAAGVLGGLAFLVEYPAVIGVAGIGIVAAWRTWREAREELGPRRPVWRWPVVSYGLGAALMLTPLLVYNYASFHNPLALGYAFVDDPAFAGARRGLFGITTPSLDALVQLAFGPAGLLTQSPYFAVPLVGLVLWLVRGPWRAEAAAVAFTFAGFLYVNAGYYLPFGGQSMGPRFLVPSLPLLALGVIGAPRWLRWLAAPAIVYSVVLAFSITAVFPKDYNSVPDALLGYWLPRLVRGVLAPNWGMARFGLEGLASLWPLAVLAALAGLGLLIALVGRRMPGRQLVGSAVGQLLGVLFLVAAVGTSTYLTLPASLESIRRPPEAFVAHVEEAAAPAGPRVRYGNEVELLGMRVADDDLTPGDALRVDLYWRTLRKPKSRYVVYVHAFGRGGEKIGEFDAVPIAGTYPMEMWPVGQVVRDTIRVRLESEAYTPSGLAIRVGVYESGVMRQLSAFDSRGQPIGDGPVLARIRLAYPDYLTGADVPAAWLEDSIGLFDWRIDTLSVRAGGDVSGALDWRAYGTPSRDYTVFVQMVGASGLVTQRDAQPLSGDFPTSLWRSGDRVPDTYRLQVPADTPPGRYRLIAGMYDVKSMARLKAGDDDFVTLGEVDVAPR